MTPERRLLVLRCISLAAGWKPHPHDEAKTFEEAVCQMGRRVPPHPVTAAEVSEVLSITVAKAIGR